MARCLCGAVLDEELPLTSRGEISKARRMMQLWEKFHSAASPRQVAARVKRNRAGTRAHEYVLRSDPVQETLVDGLPRPSRGIFEPMPYDGFGEVLDQLKRISA